MWSRTNQLIVAAAERLGGRAEPVSREPTDFFLRLRHGERSALVSKTRSPFLTQVAQSLANNKHVSRELLTGRSVPVVEDLLLDDACADPGAVAAEALRRWGRVVVKPNSGNRGIGVTVGVAGAPLALSAVARARAVDPDEEVLLEPWIDGVNVRVAVIGGEYRAAALVERPRLRGDGRTSFAAWVETLNTDPRRADWRACEVLVLDRVEPGDDDLALLELHGLGVDDPVPVGVDLELTGEESAVEDVTEELAAPWRRHAVEACRLLGVDVGGVDLRGPRAALADPASEPGLRILEVNVLPALHLHALPTSGAPRPVFEDFVAYCLQLPGAPAPGRGPAV